MKIITINTHSLEEPDYERKLHEFAGVILTEQPDVFAMQEVNQSVNAEPAYEAELAGYTRCGDFPDRFAGTITGPGLPLFWPGRVCAITGPGFLQSWGMEI